MGGVLLFLILLAIGGISVLSPESAWHMAEGWRFQDAEPSDHVLISIRIAGVIEILAAFYVLLTM